MPWRDGDTSKPQGPPHNGPIIAIYFVTALSTIVVMVRLWARWFVIKGYIKGLDDWIIMVGQIFAWVNLAISIQVLRNTTPEKRTKMYKLFIPGQFIYFMGLWICRVSGIAFYARLNPLPWFRRWLIVSFVFVTAIWIAQALLVLLQCIPLKGLWDENVQAKCMSTAAFSIATAVLTIVCDTLILLLPMDIVRQLQISLPKKLSLLACFCIGILAVIFSILRLISLMTALKHPSDLIDYLPTAMAWSAAEVSAMIMALSLPAFRGLFVFFRKNRSTIKSTTHGSNSIGLSSFPRSGNHAYGGSKIADQSTGIGYTENQSLEALCDPALRQILVQDTIRVESPEKERKRGSP